MLKAAGKTRRLQQASIFSYFALHATGDFRSVVRYIDFYQ